MKNKGPFAGKKITGPFADKAVRDFWQGGGDSRGAKRHPKAVAKLKAMAEAQRRPPFKSREPK